MFKFILFKEKLTCVYNEVISVGYDLHFYRYYDSTHFIKTPEKKMKARSLQGFLNRCEKSDSGYLYALRKNQLDYLGTVDRWKFNEK